MFVLLDDGSSTLDLNMAVWDNELLKEMVRQGTPGISDALLTFESTNYLTELLTGNYLRIIIQPIADALLSVNSKAYLTELITGNYLQTN